MPSPSPSSRRRALSALALSAALALLFAPSARAARPAAAPPPQVVQGQFHDIIVKSPKPYADPWHEVSCWVNLIRPDGSRINDCQGFYEDDGTWRIRVAPDQPGRWRWGLHFSDMPPSGTAGTGEFECTPAAVAPTGQLVQLAGNPIWFGLRGGRPILLRSLHVGDRFFAANWPDAKRTAFLDWAQAQGYNMLSVGSCLLNRQEEGRGAGWQTPDLWNAAARRPNPKEFDKLEALLADLARRGIYVHPFSGFFGQRSNFPQDPADQEIYLRYTTARLGPCWNLLFNVAGPEPLNHAPDFYGQMGAGEIVRLGLLIQSFDSYGHLISVHNPAGDDPFCRSGWSTYVTLQGFKDRDWRAISAAMLRNHADKPLLAHEVLWPGNTLGHGEFTDNDIRKKAWVLLMAAATINFGDMKGNSSSGFSGTLELSDRIQKRHDIMKRAWDLFATFPFHTMRPRPDLVQGGFCLADAGRHYLVYLTDGGPVKIDLEGGPYRAEWINPSNPAARRSAAAKDGKTYAAPDTGDWLLEIK